VRAVWENGKCVREAEWKGGWKAKGKHILQFEAASRLCSVVEMPACSSKIHKSEAFAEMAGSAAFINAPRSHER
jgi:hypothetical protein